MTRAWLRSTLSPLALLLIACSNGGDPDDAATPVPGGEPAPPVVGVSGSPSAPPSGTGDEPTSSSDPTTSAGPAATPDEPVAGGNSLSGDWTVGIMEGGSPIAGVATLTSVRAADNEGFDRFVIEFGGSELPAYHLEYVDRPVRQCGSGETVEIAGDAWLAIRLQPARAHDDQGRVTIASRVIEPGLPVMRELHIVCDFEAQVEWVIGVSSPNAYRVLELANPTRLVVDVRR